MADIFISYAREDRPRVEPIAKALEDQDWSVWWDPQIPPGKTFFAVIKEALDAAQCVVVLWSKQAINSEWVLEEANIGKRRGILVPAKLDSVEPPLGFGLIQAADLTDWEPETNHAGFQGFQNAISDIVGPSSQREKDDQVAKIPESGLEQPSEVLKEEGKIPQSIPRQPSSATVEPSEPQAGSMAASEPGLTEPIVPKPHKKSNVLKFGILVGVAVLLIAGIWWWLFQPEDARKTFGLDENWRPVKYTENQFEDQGQVVFDRATGLMWQKSGSQNYLTYEEAREYIEQLNREGFASHSDWRLPTIPELMSLLTPQKQANGLYIDPIFDADQGWCWSADKGSSGSAWGVGFGSGGVYRDDLGDDGYVRGVRS